MSPIHVVGVGLAGAADLSSTVQQVVNQATLLVGSDRHLSYFQDHAAPRIILGDLSAGLAEIQRQLSLHPQGCVVILVSGDPLFFGLGRLLLMEFPPAQLTFHPHLSAIQLAFSRIKVPWQDACVISAHGRPLDQLVQALQQGVEKIAVLSDPTNTPSAIARLFFALDLPTHYQFWVCENLGGPEEKVQALPPEVVADQSFAPLNVVVLLRIAPSTRERLDLKTLPCIGLLDQSFLSFPDRPGLMTKREVRVLALAELALQPSQVVWDLGAGTGSVAIEVARIAPQVHVYAVEKTALGTRLIQQNCQRFEVDNISVIHGSAPQVLHSLPEPNRIFVGGSGGNLADILDACQVRLSSGGIIVIAIATLEHLSLALDWVKRQNWNYHLLQVQMSRSVPLGTLTRLAPLNPVTILTAVHPHHHCYSIGTQSAPTS